MRSLCSAAPRKAGCHNPFAGAKAFDPALNRPNEHQRVAAVLRLRTLVPSFMIAGTAKAHAGDHIGENLCRAIVRAEPHAEGDETGGADSGKRIGPEARFARLPILQPETWDRRSSNRGRPATRALLR